MTNDKKATFDVNNINLDKGLVFKTAPNIPVNLLEVAFKGLGADEVLIQYHDLQSKKDVICPVRINSLMNELPYKFNIGDIYRYKPNSSTMSTGPEYYIIVKYGSSSHKIRSICGTLEQVLSDYIGGNNEKITKFEYLGNVLEIV